MAEPAKPAVAAEPKPKKPRKRRMYGWYLGSALLIGVTVAYAYDVYIPGVTAKPTPVLAGTKEPTPDPLAARQAELIRREAEVLAREQKVLEQEAQAAVLLKELGSKKTSLDALKQVASLYAAMPPFKAAPLMEALPTDQAVDVLRLLDQEQAAAILSYMDKALGAGIMVELAKPPVARTNP